MDIPAFLLPQSYIHVSYALFAVALLWAAWTAPWFKIREPSSLNVFLGAVVVLMLLWSMRAGLAPGLSFHLLGTTALCLMFGWQFAFFAVLLVACGVNLNQGGAWQMVPLNALLMGLIPIMVTNAGLFLAQRLLPLNFFIYIFINSFLAAGVASLSVSLSAYLIYSLSGAYGPHILNTQLLPFMLLVALPESTINGIVMTGTVVYKPDWVATFHDRWYLYRK